MAQRSTPCGISLGVCRLRVTLLDTAGCVASAADNSFVLSNLISIGFTPNVTTGQDLELIGGCGCTVAAYKVPDSIKRYDLTMVTPQKSAPLESLLTGGGVLYDDSPAPVPVGYSAPPTLECGEEQTPIAVEFWTKHIVDDRQDADLPWIHWVFPQTLWVPGAATANNDFAQPDFAGFSRTNPCWGDGPYGDGPEAIYGPSSFDTSTGYYWFYTPEDPPAASCDFATVVPAS